MALLDTVRAALRRKTKAFDGEIQGLIDACLIELKEAGVERLNRQPAEGETPLTADQLTAGDPLLERAVILYAKAHFGYGENVDCERFQRAYNVLKCSLSLAGDYNTLE